MLDGTINVLWNCDMGEACTNKQRPGTHEEYQDAGHCRGVIFVKTLGMLQFPEFSNSELNKKPYEENDLAAIDCGA